MRDRFKVSVSVFVIVLDDAGRVLLLRRANTGWKDGWHSLPAGAVDGGESLDAAAARELREETGLVAVSSDLRLGHMLHCRSGDDGGEWLGAFFVARRWSGEPRLGEPHRHDHIEWYSVGQLPLSTIPYARQGLTGALESRPFSTFGWK